MSDFLLNLEEAEELEAIESAWYVFAGTSWVFVCA